MRIVKCRVAMLTMIGLVSLNVIGLVPLNAYAAAAQEIEEIIVTAERRETRLQDTPLAVTVFDDSVVERVRIQSMDELVPRITGFSISANARSRINPGLRAGSSSLTAPGSDQAVALFVDDVYYGSSSDFDVGLFDMERLEVLRGPQGTLFGRNSTGGAISIVTKDPSAEAEANVEASLGNYDFVQARGFVTGALNAGKTLLGSLAFATRDRSGTSRNRTRGGDVDDVDRTSIRGKLKWLISDNTRLLLVGDYNNVNETGEALKFIGPSSASVPFETNSDPRVTFKSSNGSFDSDSWGASAKFEHDFVDTGTLVSISAYRDLDTSGSPQDEIDVGRFIFDYAEPQDLKQFSQEVRFASEMEGRLNFVAGAFFLYQDASRDIHWDWQNDPGTFAGVLQAVYFCPEQDPENIFFVNPACLASQPELWEPGQGRWFQRSKVYSYAEFLQVSYEITPEVTLTVGGRYTIDDKTVEGYVDGDLSFAVNQIANPGFMGTAGGYSVPKKTESWDRFTPRVTIDWKPAEDLMLYATYSEGYRAGAFQIENDPTVPPLEPEYVKNYEAGVKSRFLDDKVQLNVAAFDAEYTNLQFQYTDETGTSLVSNAGQAKVKGAEVELTVNPVPGLSLGANYSYQEGDVTGIPVQLGLPNGIDPAQMPPDSLNLTAVYELALTSGGRVTLSADYQYKSEYQLELNPDPVFRSKVPGLVNGNISYQTPGEKWRFTIWGKNLTDEEIVIYANDFLFFAYSVDDLISVPGAAEARIVRYAAPRTYGVTARMSF
jgi:iron complex outermembrane recepter protein